MMGTNRRRWQSMLDLKQFRKLGSCAERDDFESAKNDEMPLVVGDDFLDSRVLEGGRQHGVEQPLAAQLVTR